jgi:cytochrome c-type biogenesis protein CcmH
VDGSNQKVGSVSSMVDGLRARLEQNPNDAKGWLLLARSYKHLNRPGDAAYAYGQAVLLGEVDSELAPLLTANSDDEAAQIFGNLSLSLHAAEVVQPTDTVFIFARAANEAGVPAAVLQRPASELPIDFLLNDSQAMVEDVKLSDFESVVVTARISRSGNATEALQGLEAKSEPVVVADNKHINLIIE